MTTSMDAVQATGNVPDTPHYRPYDQFKRDTEGILRNEGLKTSKLLGRKPMTREP